MPDAAVAKDVPANPCCALWKDKFAKLQQKCAKLEEGRTALRRGIELYELQIDQMQNEVTSLKKEGSETEVDSEISSLRQKECSKVDYPNEELMLVLDCDETEMNRLREQLQEAKTEVDSERRKAQEEKKTAEDALKTIKEEKVRVDEELRLLQSHLCDRETEINLLREQFQEEIIRAASEEKKKAEAGKKKADEACEKAKAEKLRADEELTFLRSLFCEKETEINRLREQLEEVRIGAASEEEKKTESEKRKADEACESAKVEKLRADEDLKLLRSLVCEKETEINLLREQLKKARAKKASQDKKKKVDKACESAKPKKDGFNGLQDDMEKEDKLKESTRNCFEDEISSLKSQILLLQQKGASRADNVDEEVALLRVRVSEGETEINRLKELLNEERIRADLEKKKAEAEKKNAYEAWETVKAQKCRIDEERRFAYSEREKAKENKLQLEKLQVEADETKLKLVTETLKCEEANKMLEAERQHAIKEKNRADSGKGEAEKLRKLAELNKSNALEEKSRADRLCQQLEEYRLRFEKLKEMEEPLSSREMVEIPIYEPVKGMNGSDAETENGIPVLNQNTEESNSEEAERRFVETKCKENLRKKGFDFEMREAVKHRKVAKAYREKALEEKARADKLTQQLEENRRLTENLRKEMEFVSPKMLLDAYVNPAEKNMSAEMKLLRKELKLEKSRVKYAKQVAKLESNYKKTLEQELYQIKTEFIQFSHRVGLCNCVTKCNNGCSNSKRKRMSSDQFMQLASTIVNPSYAYMEDCLKQSIECTSQFLPASVNQMKSTSGIASKLQPLLRGSNRKRLHSSAIDSSMASFSDNPLVGSQERGTLSVPKSAERAEEKLKSQFPISSLSGEVRSHDSKMVAVNSVRNPLDDVGRDQHSKKRRQIVDTVEVVDHLFSEDKKWHPQIVENAYMLHHALESQMDKTSHKFGSVLPNPQDNLYPHIDCHQKNIHTALEEKGSMGHLFDYDSQKDNHVTETIEGTNFYLQCTSPLDNVTGIAQTCKDSGKRDLECFEKVADGNYMRLLDLDDTSDEESYRLAVERPLSPTLPEIVFRSSKVVETGDCSYSFIGCLLEELSNLKDCTVPYSGIDATNEKIDSNLSNLGASGILDSCKTFDEKSKSGAIDARSASFSQIPNYVVKEGVSNFRDKGFKTLSDGNFGSTQDSSPQYCVVFSDIKESSSISKIFYMTRTLKNQCRICSDADCVVEKLMTALVDFDDLLPKEKSCVFFSVLLDYCYCNVRRHVDGDSQFLDFSVGHMMKVMSDLDTRSILDELITLIEDFLIYRRILIQVDGTEPSVLSDPRVIVLNCGDVKFSFQTASSNLLICGAVALASLCAEFDRVGFLCEASYNVTRLKKLDSLVLTILHVFAYICGRKYFALTDYSLIMTVMKALVTSRENESRSTRSTSFDQSMALEWPEFPMCSQCPFHERAVPINELVALLLEKLHSYSCLHKFEGLAFESHSDSDSTLCRLTDVLSLLELTASNMSWEWTCDKIIGQLSTVLESPASENYLVASLILLGQLLRIGIDAKGPKDDAVKNIQGKLCAFLSESTARKVTLPVQIATVGALLGIMSPTFEEVIGSNTQLPEVSSLLIPADCIRKWYSSLSSEQKPSSYKLLKTDMPSCDKGVTLARVWW